MLGIGIIRKSEVLPKEGDLNLKLIDSPNHGLLYLKEPLCKKTLITQKTRAWMYSTLAIVFVNRYILWL